MFSGIRYILGYTDDEPAVGGAAASETSGEQPREVDTLVSASTAALEKTLNAATTKFTEQLLPQQASIEQLQSSSHQLLPSITEQHEENESKKHVKLDEGIEAIELEASGFATVDNIDDDDDCLEADSWELLDLVEKAENQTKVGGSGSAASSTPKGDSSPVGLSRSSSGILKSTSGSLIGISVCQQPSRQKPKVSFETPDLVNSKQEIEQNKPKDAKVSSLPKKGKSKRSKRNAKTTGVDISEKRAENQPAVQVASIAVATEKEIVAKGDKAVQSLKSDKKPEGANPSLNDGIEIITKASPQKLLVAPVSTLNYAKALSAKPKSEAAQKVTESVHVVVEQPLMETTIGNEKKKDEKQKKKNEVENGGKMTEQHFPALSCGQLSSENCIDSNLCSAINLEKDSDYVEADLDIDAISLTSSGFSDCDFGFGGVNDYVMRPKKANTKRNRTQSGSSGSFRAPKVGRGHSTKHAGANNRQPAVTSNDNSKNSSSKAAGTVAKATSSAQAAASKNSKPKRKRLASTSSSGKTATEPNSTDFLKPSQADETKRKQLKGQTGGKLETKSVSKQSPVSSSNDSSEIPEMDESWYVTPPPCFTGKQNAANKGEHQPKAKEAARENALIEHPSIYIASSSKSILMERAALNANAASSLKSTILLKKSTTKVTPRVEAAPEKAPVRKLEDAAWQSDDDDDVEAFDDDQFICSKPLSKPAVSVQVQTAVAKSVETALESKPKSVKKAKLGGTKRVSSSSSIAQADKIKVKPVGVKPIEKRAWKNKFIVDDWELDEQENVDSDFDSMFEPVKKRKTKAKRQQQQQQRSKKAQRGSATLPFDVTTDSDDLSQETLEIVIDGGASGNSVELISIRSLSMENSMENANGEMNLFAPGEEVAEEVESVKEPVKEVEKRRQPIQVRRIEPERRPGWQLKKQRSKRRPLASSNIDNKQQSSCIKSSKRSPSSSSLSQSSASSSGGGSPTLSASSSSRSSPPTFMDRIGSSIVANLTNLTNGLVSSGALNTCTPVGHSSPLVEGAERMQQQQQNVASRVNANGAVANLGARKQLSRNSLRRQSVTAVQANMQRRPDRRLKMFAYLNGSSVNRKVHASIH